MANLPHKPLIITVMVLAALTACAAPDAGPTGTTPAPAVTPSRTAIATATYTLTPEPSPTLTLTPTPFDISVPADLFLPENTAGMVPSGAIARFGIGGVSELAQSPDGSLLAIGTSAGLHLMDLTSGQYILQQALYAPVEGLEWSPDGAYLATSLFEWDEILIWNRNGELIRQLINNNEVNRFEWSPDSTRIAVAMGRGFLALRPDLRLAVAMWDVASGNRIWLTEYGAQLGHMSDSTPNVTWLLDGETIGVNWNYEFSNTYKADTGEEVTVRFPYTEDVNSGFYLHPSPTGDLIAVHGDYLHESETLEVYVNIWDLSTQHVLHQLNHPNWTHDIIWSPDGETILIGVGPLELFTHEPIIEQIYIWDARSWTLQQIIEVDDLDLDTLRWSEDGSEAISGDRLSGQIMLWDTAKWTGTPQGFDFPRLSEFVDHPYITYPPDANPLIWNVDSGEVQFKLDLHSANGYIAWSPDGKQIATVPYDLRPWQGSSTLIWDIEPSSLVEVAESNPPPTGWDTTYHAGIQYNIYSTVRVEFISNIDDTLRASTVEERIPDDPHYQYPLITITVRDNITGEVLHTFVEHGNFIVRSMCFSPDSRYLAVGHNPPKRGSFTISAHTVENGFVNIYDLQSGDLAQTVVGHTGGVYEISWSLDGKRLGTSSNDGTIILWDVSDLP